MSLGKIDSNQPSLRSIYTSHRFTRLNLFPTSRNTKTSDAPRAFPHQMKNKTLENSKENLGFASYMKKVESSSKIDEKAQISKYLWSLRKQFDKLTKITNKKKLQIQRMQKEIEQLKKVNQDQKNCFSSVLNEVAYRREEIKGLDVHQEEVRMDKKILLNIIERMKTDSLWRKCEGRKNENIIKKKETALKNAEEASIQWDQTIHKMTEKYMKFKKQLDQQNSERKLKLMEYESRICDLEEKQNFELERRSRTYQLLNMQSNDIMDAKNIMLRDVIFAHKFLSSVLQNKIEDLLKKNEQYEQNYHRIKTQTNFDDPKNLCQKFFSYGQILKQISSKITLYEKKLEETTNLNKSYVAAQNQKRIKRLQQQKIRSIKQNNFLAEKEDLHFKAIQKELQVKKIRQWTKKSLAIINCEELLGPDQNIQQNFDTFCKNLLSQVQEVKDLSLSSIKYQAPSFRMKKVLKQLSIEDERLKRNEAIQVRQSNAYEAVYIQKQRKQLKKSRFVIKNQVSPKPKKQ